MNIERNRALMKQGNKLFAILGIIPIMLSCHSISNITGTYSMRNNPHKFVINADSTFNYFYIIAGEADKHSSGKWSQIDKNMIVLNSNVQSNIIPLDIEVMPANNKNTIINVELNVPDKDEKEYRVIPQYAIIENKWYVPSFEPDRGSYSYESTVTTNELFYKVSKEPRVFERLGPLKKYYVLETEHKEITTKIGDIINVRITVPDSLFSYRVFDSEKIKVNGKKLVFRDREDNNKTNKLHIED